MLNEAPRPDQAFGAKSLRFAARRRQTFYLSEYSQPTYSLSAAPSAPLLKAPLNLTVVPTITPKLVVIKPVGGYRYQFQVSAGADFSTLLVDAINKGPSFAVKKTVGLLSGHTYIWRVAVLDKAGNKSLWSEVGTFSVK